MNGTNLPKMKVAPPGPISCQWVTRLAKTECPAITARRARRATESGVPQDPMVWESALGANVQDVDGNIYVDLTAAFAVGGLGHRHPKVVQAGHAQLDKLIHAMGDVYPSDVKIALSERLAELAPGDLQQSILGLSGADAIGAALKTTVMKTGKSGVIAFWGGYHGLSHGALAATAYRKSFREPFLAQLNSRVRHFPYPDPFRPPFGMALDSTPESISAAVLAHLRDSLSHPASGLEDIGAILVEPILGRGGEVVPPPGFLAGLRKIADEFGILLIFDEIFSGFGRTGRMFACEHEGVTPDLLCVGKALGGGFPMSAVIGTPEVMAGWGNSKGESIHTTTFLGNPLGAAMALASLNVLVDEKWPERVAEIGTGRLDDLIDLKARHRCIGDVRGKGLMLGVEFIKDDLRTPDGMMCVHLMEALRKDGYLVLPSGSGGNVLGLSPPFVLTDEQWRGFMAALEKHIVIIAPDG